MFFLFHTYFCYPLYGREYPSEFCSLATNLVVGAVATPLIVYLGYALPSHLASSRSSEIAVIGLAVDC